MSVGLSAGDQANRGLVVRCACGESHLSFAQLEPTCPVIRARAECFCNDCHSRLQSSATAAGFALPQGCAERVRGVDELFVESGIDQEASSQQSKFIVTKAGLRPDDDAAKTTDTQVLRCAKCRSMLCYWTKGYGERIVAVSPNTAHLAFPGPEEPVLPEVLAAFWLGDVLSKNVELTSVAEDSYFLQVAAADAKKSSDLAPWLPQLWSNVADKAIPGVVKISECLEQEPVKALIAAIMTERSSTSMSVQQFVNGMDIRYDGEW